MRYDLDPFICIFHLYNQVSIIFKCSWRLCDTVGRSECDDSIAVSSAKVSQMCIRGPRDPRENGEMVETTCSLLSYCHVFDCVLGRRFLMYPTLGFNRHQQSYSPTTSKSLSFNITTELLAVPQRAFPLYMPLHLHKSRLDGPDASRYLCQQSLSTFPSPIKHLLLWNNLGAKWQKLSAYTYTYIDESKTLWPCA